MAQFGPTPNTNYTEIGVFNSTFPSEGPKIIPVQLPFNLQQSFNVDLSLLQQRGVFKMLQSVWVDNSGNTTPLSISVAGTNQTLKVPGSSQAYLPIFVPQLPQFTITNTGGQPVLMYFTNIPLPAAVWGASGGFTFTGGGALEVSDTTLDATVTNNQVNTNENATGNNNVSKPVFVADELFTGSSTGSAAATLTTGAPSFFITDVFVALSADAAISGGAAELVVTIKDGATVILTGIADVPAASLTTNLTFPAIIESRGLQYNSKSNAAALTINFSATLTTGKIYWNVAGGLCTNIGP